MNHDVLETNLRSLHIPNVDVHDRVMGQIGGSRVKSMKFQKTAFIMALSVAVVCITGFAAVRMIIDLYNEQHLRVMTLKAFDEENPMPLRLFTEEEINGYMASLLPGESIALHRPENNPQRIIQYFTKPVEFEQLAELRSMTGPYQIPASFPPSFEFVKGSIQYQSISLNPADIFRQAEEHPGQPVVRKAETSHEVMNVAIHLGRGTDEYVVILGDGARWNTVFTEPSKVSTSKVIKVSGIDGVITVASGKKELMWNNGETYVSISTSDLSADADRHLVELLTALIQ